MRTLKPKKIDSELYDINADLHALSDEQKQLIESMAENGDFDFTPAATNIRQIADKLCEAYGDILDSYRTVLSAADKFAAPLRNMSLLFSFSDNEKKNAAMCLNFYKFLGTLQEQNNEISYRIALLSEVVRSSDKTISNTVEQKCKLRLCRLAARISGKYEKKKEAFDKSEAELNAIENDIGELRSIALSAIRLGERFVSYTVPDFARQCEMNLDAKHRGANLHVGNSIHTTSVFRNALELLCRESEEYITKLKTFEPYSSASESK